jgi:hypothetical protein
MLFFLNILEKGCISGKGIPSLSIHMGAAGKSDRYFPGFGRLSRKDWSRAERLQPMFLVGVLSLAEHDAQLQLDEQRCSVVDRVRGSGISHRDSPGPD